MYIIGLDTETCNGHMDSEGNLDLSESLVYDLGYAVIDLRSGEIVTEKSFIIGDVFIDMKDVMLSAFYADKIPQYWKEYREGKRKIVSFHTARRTLMEDMKNYKVKQVFAHNAFFDLNALNQTERYLTKSKYRFFFRWGTEIVDTLRMARETICQTSEYVGFCLRYGYMTKHKKPRVRATAEILYRYLSGNNNFSEAHTGLEDVKIEKEIFNYIRKHYPEISLTRRTPKK